MNKIFNTLNYTLGNEDNYLEHYLLPYGVNHVMCVAGSGVSPMALLSKGPRILSCVDTAREQLYITELRIATARHLSYESFLSFWSYPGFTIEPAERKSLFNTLVLAHETRLFFIKYFEKARWGSILYSGRLEKFGNLLVRPYRLLMGKKWKDIFYSSTIDEQHRFFNTKFPKKRFDLVIFLFSFFYRISLVFIKDIMRENMQESFYALFHRIFYTLIQDFYLKENFYLQYFFNGRILFLEACPPECDPDIFTQIKKSIEHCDIRYIQENIVHAAQKSDEPINFFDFSNVPSYFTGEMERAFLQDIKPVLDEHALVLNRYHIHLPEKMDSSGFNNVSQDYKDIINSEATQLYHIELYEKI